MTDQTQQAASSFNKEEREAVATLRKLHQGKLGAHWIWCALQQIANGQSEIDVLREYCYAPTKFGSWNAGNAGPGDFSEDVAALAAAPAVGAPVAEHGQLDPRTAIEQARTMLRYCDAFNGQKFSPLDDVDRINLATALDNLQETASMLLNMAGRVTAPPAASLREQEDDRSCRLAWAKYAARKHSWLNSYLPPMRDGRFDCAGHESEYQDFLAGVRHGR